MTPNIQKALDLMCDVAACSGDWEAPETIKLAKQLTETLERLTPDERLAVNDAYGRHVIGGICT